MCCRASVLKQTLERKSLFSLQSWYFFWGFAATGKPGGKGLLPKHKSLLLSFDWGRLYLASQILLPPWSSLCSLCGTHEVHT